MKEVAEKPFSFRVIAVVDGECSGLLLERTKAGEIKPTYGYFWLDESHGLASTQAIEEKCGVNCHCLEVSRDYKGQTKKKARIYNQERIFRELLAYTKTIGGLDNIIDERPLTQNYSDNKKGYPEVLQKFFAAEPSKFSEFLISSEIFRRHVLRKVHAKEFLIGKAEKFELQNPRNIFPEDNFDYLLTTEKILRIKNPPEAEWFRSTGPIFSDFNRGKFYRRAEVDLIKEKISKNRFYLLEGDAATAKTVIVRTIMYELYKEGKTKVYYFDIGSERSFDKTKLVKDIRSVKGTFIIENIHLESRKAQWLYLRFINDLDRHLLFTSRPGYEEFQDRTVFEDLERIEKLVLEPFADVEKLIKHFCSDPDTPNVVWDKREDIIGVSKDDFWFLVFALQACANLKGVGKPEDWIAEVVKSHLQNLENCRDQHCDQYLGILVALSPLYINEVLTAESYLKKLGFTRAALNGLVERGEITRQKELNNRFYGLIHSSHAKAYWEHGKEYISQINLRKYEEFIYDYAVSDMPNGLEALIKLNRVAQRHIFTKLNSEKLIIRVIQGELSLWVISRWLSSKFCKYPLKHELIKVLSKKICFSEDLSSIVSCISAIHDYKNKRVAALWNALDMRKIVSTINKTTDFLSFIVLLNCIEDDLNQQVAFELIELINYKKVARNIIKTQSPGYALSFVAQCLEINFDCGMKIWQDIDLVRLSTNLTNNESVHEVFSGIGELFQINDALGDKIWKLLDKKKLKDRLNQIQNAYYIRESIAGIFQWRFLLDTGIFGRFYKKAILGDFKSWKNATDEFAKMLDLNVMAQNLINEKNEKRFVNCLAYICRIDKNLGAKLIELLGIENVIKFLTRAGTDLYSYRDIYIICFTNPEKMVKRFIASLNIKALVGRLSRKRLPSGVDFCICVIYIMDNDLCGYICKQINLNTLCQKRLKHKKSSRFRQQYEIDSFIKAVKYVKKKKPCNLQEIFKKGIPLKDIPWPIQSVGTYDLFWNQVL